MRLGSSEHYGWERARTVRLVQVLDGDHTPGEWAHLHVPDGAKGGPFDVMVRARRAPPRAWRAPERGERFQVQAWHLMADDATLRRLAVDLGEPLPWSPPKLAPDLWLWVEG